MGTSGADDPDDLMDESDVSKQFEDVSTPNARKTQRKYKLLGNNFGTVNRNAFRQSTQCTTNGNSH